MAAAAVKSRTATAACQDINLHVSTIHPPSGTHHHHHPRPSSTEPKAKMMRRALLRRALRLPAISTPTRTRPAASLRPSINPRPLLSARAASHTTHPQPSLVRHLSSSNKSPADDKVDEITELYATAQDEFEIAMEETEKMSVYAEEDRKAARDELERVKEAYRAVVEGGDKEVGEEVRRRVGQRIRELEQGVKAMEELAMNQD